MGKLLIGSLKWRGLHSNVLLIKINFSDIQNLATFSYSFWFCNTGTDWSLVGRLFEV